MLPRTTHPRPGARAQALTRACALITACALATATPSAPALASTDQPNQPASQSQNANQPVPAHTPLRLTPLLGAQAAVRVTSTEETVQVTGQGLTLRHTGTGTILRDLLFRVAEVDEDRFTLAATITDAGVAEARAEHTGPPTPETADARAQAQQLDAAYRALVDQHATLTVRTDGVITQALGPNTNTPLWPIIEQFVRGGWPYALPQDPLAREWSFALDQPLPNGLSQSTNTAFTLLRASDDSFELAIEQSSASPEQPLPEGALDGGRTGTLRSTGSAAGTITIDRATGVVTHADITSTSTTLFTIESAEDGEPNTVEQTTTIHITAEPTEPG